MGTEESRIKKLLRKLPGGKEGDPEDKGNSVEFPPVKIGKKGNSIGLTFPSGAQILGKIKAGMRARIIMEREPGSSIFTARIYFIEAESEGRKDVGSTT